MKHITILLPRGAAALSCIEGSLICLQQANAMLVLAGRDPIFEIQLTGIDKTPQVYERLFRVDPDTSITALTKTDLIIVPAVNGDMTCVIENNKEFLPWIRQQYEGGAEVASLCVGAFIVAATGLLDGKQCSTHWIAANEFRTRFPNVRLVSEKIITDDHGIYSSGGAISFYNLLLYIIAKYAGRDIAVLCAKYFEIEIDRFNQSPFIMFQGQKEHGDEPVKKAQVFIENNIRQRITVDQLSEMFAVGRRSLERRFKKATRNTVSEYIQRVKMEAAKKRFETSRAEYFRSDVRRRIFRHEGIPLGFQENHRPFTGGIPQQVQQGGNDGVGPRRLEACPTHRQLITVNLS